MAQHQSHIENATKTETQESRQIPGLGDMSISLGSKTKFVSKKRWLAKARMQRFGAMRVIQRTIRAAIPVDFLSFSRSPSG
jgi:hypothetical protein